MKTQVSDIRPLWLLLAGMLQCCILTSNDGDLRETPMVFIPTEYTRNAAGESGGYRIHPPYWRRIHRDSVAFVVEAPPDDSSDLIFRYTIRNPKTGDSASGEVPLSGSGPGARLAYLPPEGLGGRGILFSPFLCDLQLFRESPYSNPEAKPIISKRFLMDPNPESLDLHPFIVHFFPDRIGMVLRSRYCHVSGRGAAPVVRETVRTLIDWKMVAKDSGNAPGCASDSVVQLRFQGESSIGMQSETGESPAFTECGEAIKAELPYSGSQTIEEDKFLCKDAYVFTLDSAQAANSRFTREYIFGEYRLVSSTFGSLTGGNSWSWTQVSGIGRTSDGSTNGVSHIITLEEILEVN